MNLHRSALVLLAPAVLASAACASGSAIVTGSRRTLVGILTQHELSEDPHDLVASYLLNSTTHLSAGTQGFAAIYLLWHGAVKVALVTALLLNRRWAYPVAILAFALFAAYQLYRLLAHPFA